MSNPSNKPSQNNQLLLKYAGLTMQLMVALAIAFFAGYKIDEWIQLKTPMFIWVLPLVVIIIMMWKVIKDTSKK